MTPALKVGDRVRLKGFALNMHTGEARAVDGQRATLIISDGNTVVFEFDNQKHSVFVSQCRRIVPHKRRRVWLNPLFIPDNLSAVSVSSGGTKVTSLGPIDGWIEFREARRKEKERP
jgi:hypothetical protein